MKQISHLLASKSRKIWSVRPDATVFEAIEQMALRGIGALLVMEGERLVGIISERDYTRKVILQGRSSRETEVREIMTEKVICISMEFTVSETMALMTEKRVRHLPVIADQKVVGVISIGDVVRGVIEDKEFDIQQLTNYITGGAMA